MQKIMVNLENIDVALNKFNNAILSEELNDYIINEAKKNIYKENIALIIYNVQDLQEQTMIKNVIHNFYKNKLVEYKKLDKYDNYFHFVLLLIGLLMIIISEQFTYFVSELFLIAGWVVIWEMIYDIFFTSIKRKRCTLILKKLANCSIDFIS